MVWGGGKKGGGGRGLGGVRFVKEEKVLGVLGEEMRGRMKEEEDEEERERKLEGVIAPVIPRTEGEREREEEKEKETERERKQENRKKNLVFSGQEKQTHLLTFFVALLSSLPPPSLPYLFSRISQELGLKKDGHIGEEEEREKAKEGENRAVGVLREMMFLLFRFCYFFEFPNLYISYKMRELVKEVEGEWGRGEEGELVECLNSFEKNYQVFSSFSSFPLFFPSLIFFQKKERI